ncbi:MAG: 3(2), 5-bisphosphate nucleotidase [Actinomycetota bacterium]|jgi:3'(2'), 5'-bisphosphate nucleotidase|nr:3(2), 5-bisphosphate nucleotidase [Actinomycetota bacterium]
MSASAADHADAARIATEAGDLLVDLRTGLQRGMAPDEIRHLGDSRSHALIAAALAEAHPADAVLSEEAADRESGAAARATAPRVWIVDPLDGTREFGEEGRTDWAVHVALVVDGTVSAAAVALPAQAMTLSTSPPPSSPPAHPGRPRIVVSRTRPPALALSVADELGAELVPMGSAGAKAMAVVTGAVDCYLHSGGQYEWDSAAPVGVAAAAGLHTSRLDGSPLVYNRPDAWLPDLLICRRELAAAILTTAARFR